MKSRRCPKWGARRQEGVSKGECGLGDDREREVFGTRHGKKEGLARRGDAGFGGSLAKGVLEEKEKRGDSIKVGAGEAPESSWALQGRS